MSFVSCFLFSVLHLSVAVLFRAWYIIPQHKGMCQDIRVVGPGVLWGSLPRASLVVQTIKNLPAMQEIQVWSLSWEDPLEKGMATHSSIFTQRISWTEEPGGLQPMGSQRTRRDWAINTCLTRVIGQKVDGSCYKQPGTCGVKGSKLQGFSFSLPGPWVGKFWIIT